VAGTRILLVEDELPLLELLDRYLKRVGFSVTTFSDSVKALADFEAAPGNYDLVVADLGMPEISGDAMLRRMLAIRPDLMILICSGSPFYTSNLPKDLEKQVAFLQKPFLPKMMSETIDQLLRRRTI